MRYIRNRWIRGVGAVVLVGALLVTGIGAYADDDDDKPKPKAKSKNPFIQILDKLDEISSKLGRSDGGNHTLRWDTNNPSASRFTTAFTGAVRDKNTGLVWEQAPDATPRDWPGATRYCADKTVGGTVGWRLPSVVELKSMQDPSLPAPFVPASVFTGVQLHPYWSASSVAETPTAAWNVFFAISGIGTNVKSFPLFTWCVRGGMNADQY